MYDSTVKAMGFDEIRVRYRQERRALIRALILNKLTGTTMKEYIYAQTVKLAKEENQKSFLEDVMEDLREMDLSRLAGLGITPDQLRSLAWKES
jgi:hypothetical protein